MTREEAIANHRNLWCWISDETVKQSRCVSKFEYFSYHNIKPVHAFCFCCEYSINHAELCSKCLVDWKNDARDPYLPGCLSAESPYYKWRRACDTNNYNKAAQYAKEIADLPERVRE